MKALLLDMTHGGQVLAPYFKNEGYDVTVADVYKIAPQSMLDDLKSKGIKVFVGKPDPGHFDIVSMPCHCPDIFLEGCTYDKREWYSQSVSRYITDKRFRIEVTGVKGKTSTCYLIAHLLANAGKRVYLRSSRGSGPYTVKGHDIQELKSIAPPYLLELPPEDYDIMICEVSLGGSAKADIACITNLLENYGIAKKTRYAEEGKKDILTAGTNIVLEKEKDIWSKYGKPLKTVKSRVKVIETPELRTPLELEFDYHGKHRAVIPGCCLGLQYIEALEMALEVCDTLSIPPEAVIEGLSTFGGVPGRGEVRKDKDRWYVLERNPGISHMSVRRTLETLKTMKALDGALVIIDPVSKKVCDKLDRDLIEGVVKEFGVDLIVTPGDGTEPDVPDSVRLVIRMIKEGYQ